MTASKTLKISMVLIYGRVSQNGARSEPSTDVTQRIRSVCNHYSPDPLSDLGICRVLAADRQCAESRQNSSFEKEKNDRNHQIARADFFLLCARAF